MTALYPISDVRVIDGDSIACRVALPLDVSLSCCCRLDGIDTPELRDADPVKREMARKAKDRLASLVATSTCVIVTSGVREKYGRLLVKLWATNGTESFNDILVREGLAVRYNGGARLNQQESDV